MLKVNHLSVTRESKFLLQDISLELHSGSLYPLIGPNGSGKTTLLKTLAGMIAPSQGKIYWQDQDLHLLPRNEISKIISFTPHNMPVPFDFTVEQFVRMGLYAQGKCQSQDSGDLIREALRAVNAIDFFSSCINRLSQGERQRIFVARAIVSKTKVYAFDEPTANMDKKHQALIWELMQCLADQNNIVIIATHDMHSIQKYTRNQIVLEEGIQTELLT